MDYNEYMDFKTKLDLDNANYLYWFGIIDFDTYADLFFKIIHREG